MSGSKRSDVANLGGPGRFKHHICKLEIGPDYFGEDLIMWVLWMFRDAQKPGAARQFPFCLPELTERAAEVRSQCEVPGGAQLSSPGMQLLKELPKLGSPRIQ